MEAEVADTTMDTTAGMAGAITASEAEIRILYEEYESLGQDVSDAEAALEEVKRQRSEAARSLRNAVGNRPIEVRGAYFLIMNRNGTAYLRQQSKKPKDSVSIYGAGVAESP